MQCICAELNIINRVDIVWDQYFDSSLKNTTRANLVEVLEGKQVRKQLYQATGRTL